MLQMRLRHMRGVSRVAVFKGSRVVGHLLSLMINGQGGSACMNHHVLFYQLIWYGVEVTVVFHMVIKMNSGLFNLKVLIGGWW